MTTSMILTWPTLLKSGGGGSVVSSWLLDLAATAFAENPTLSNFSGRVSDSGEGRWTIMAAIDEAVEVDVLSAALFARFRSRKDHTMAEKVCSAMRFNLADTSSGLQAVNDSITGSL